MMAITAVLSPTGILTLTGTTGADNIFVALSTRAGEVNYSDGTGIGSTVVTGVNGIVLDPLDGDDHISFAEPKGAFNRLTSGVTLYGGPGNDLLEMMGGDETVLLKGGYAPTAPDAGVFSYGRGGATPKQTVAVQGFETINDTMAIVDFTASGTGGNDQLEILPGPDLGQQTGLSQGPVFIDGGDRDEHGSEAQVLSFPDWNKTGLVYSHDNTLGLNVPQGALHAEITTRGQVNSQIDVENALKLAKNDLLSTLPSGMTPPRMAGASAIYRDVTVNAGDTLTFTYNYLTENSALDVSWIATLYPDAAFFTVSDGTTTSVQTLSQAALLTTAIVPPITVGFYDYTRTSGLQSGSYTFAAGGTYRIGFGTTAGGFSSYSQSGLFLDNVRINNGLITNGGFENVATIVENAEGWKFIEQAVNYIHTNSFIPTATKDILAIGVDPNTTAADALDSVARALGLQYDVVNYSFNGTNEIATVNFNDYRLIYVPSNYNTSGGISGQEQDALAARRAEIQGYVRRGGGIVALTDAYSQAAGGAYSWLEIPARFVIDQSIAGTALRKSPFAVNAGFTISDAELTAGTPYHNTFSGPAGFNGLVPFVYDAGINGTPGDGDDKIVALGQAALDLGGGGGKTFAMKLGQTTELRLGRKTNIAIDAGAGDDFINMHGVTNQSLRGVNVPFSVRGGIGRDLFRVDDRANFFPIDITIESDTVVGITTEPFTFAQMENVQVYASSGDDKIDLDFSGPLGDMKSLLVGGGAGLDTFGDQNRIGPVSGLELSFDGGGPSGSLSGDVLNLNLAPFAGQAIVDAAAGTVLAANARPLNFRDMESITVDGGQGVVSVNNGDLFVRGTPNADVLTFERGAAQADILVRVKMGNRYSYVGPFRPTGKIVVDALSGNDFVELGPTATTRAAAFFGGDGVDTLIGGINTDTLVGGRGQDRIYGRGGNDVLWGDMQNDRLGTQTDETDYLYGEGGADSIFGGGGNDFIYAGQGDDYALGGRGDDNVRGDEGHDLLRGDFGADIMQGGVGNDILLGSDGNDTLDGQTGRDVVLAGDGVDNLVDADGDEDILLTDRSSYDYDNGLNANRSTADQAVTSILAEWVKTTDINLRIAAIRNGGGSNGTNRLSKANSSVIVDAAIDSLSGSTLAADWIIARNVDRRTGTNGADILDVI